jgi:hypothetical protein
MQPEENDHAEDDGGEEDLSNVVVEDLLVGVGGIAEVCLLLSWRFTVAHGTQCPGYVLFYVHVLDSLGCGAEISRRSQCCSWGVPRFPGARVFITKVPLHYNYFFANSCRLTLVGQTECSEAARGIRLERRGGGWTSPNWA